MIFCDRPAAKIPSLKIPYAAQLCGQRSIQRSFCFGCAKQKLLDRYATFNTGSCFAEPKRVSRRLKGPAQGKIAEGARILAVSSKK
jgi:hypothetical protein